MRCPDLSALGAALCLTLVSGTALMSQSGPPGAAIGAAVTKWSSPVQIAATTGTAGPALVTNASGASLATWAESLPNTLNARIFTPGAGWGPTVVLSDGSGNLQPPQWTAIGDDGTAVVGWRQVIEQPAFESQAMVRVYTPGGGWSPAQKLSTLGGFGTAAVAPDGRVHMVYLDGDPQGFAIRTLDPGSQTWSAPVVVPLAGFEGPGQLLAETGLAYAPFMAGPSLLLGMYTAATGWTAPDVVATGSPETGVYLGQPQIALSNGQAIFAWIQYENGLTTHQYVRRLTGAGGTFEVPMTSCRFALRPDATVVAACDQNLGEVAGCFDPTRGGPVPAHYHQNVLYRLSPDNVWSGPEALSNAQVRATQAQVITNHNGNVFAYWTQDVPCRTGTRLVGGRLLQGGRWRSQVDNTEGLGNYGTSITIDDKAIVRAIWAADGVYNGDDLFYAELAPPAPIIAPESGRLYHIISRQSGKCLSGKDQGTDSATTVVQETCSQAPAQAFRFRDVGGGHFNIVNAQANKDIEVAGIGSDNGGAVYLRDDSGGDNQKIRVKPTSDGFFGLIAAHSGKALQVAGSTADDIPIIQGDYHGGDNQQWSLEELPDQS